MNSEINPVMDAALRYRNAGLSVIPIRADGSKAAAKPWKQFQDRLPSSKEIEESFSPKVGIAAVCGAVSGNLETLDFEYLEYYEQWKLLVDEAAPGLLPRLPCIQTPRGGRHIPYRSSAIEGSQKLAEEPSIDEKTGKPSRKTLIESRGEGAYIVTSPSPGSCHPTGREYIHLSGPPLTETPVITPEERRLMVDLCRSFNKCPKQFKEEYSSKAKNYVPGDRPGDDFNARATFDEVLAPHGWRQIRKTGDVGYWQRPGKTGSGISATTDFCGDKLHVFSSNAYPFEPDTTYSKFAVFTLLEYAGDFSAAAADLARRGYGKTNSSYSTSDKREKGPIEWPEIIPLKNLGCPSPFPKDALPPRLAKIFAHLAQVVQVPIELCFSVGISVIATAIGARAAIQLPTHKEPSSIWTCCVLDPGSRKSAIFKVLTEPLMKFERSLQEDWRPKWRTWRVEADIAEERSKKARKEENAEVLKQALEILEKEPIRPVLWTEDTTSEALRKLLEENGSIGVLSAEGGSVLEAFGRYNGSKGADMGIWLAGHAGDPGKSTRLGRESEATPNPLLSVGFTVQFEVLQSIGADRTAKGRGFLDRIAWNIPPDPRGHRSYEKIGTISSKILLEWELLVKNILNISVQKEIPSVLLSLPASEKWKHFATEIERRQLPGGDLRPISGWASKLAGLAGRLALAFHFAEGHKVTEHASEFTMSWAINLSKHLIDHAKVALSVVREDETVRLAEVILRHIQDKKLEKITSREVLTNGWGGCASSEDATGALLKLSDHGYLVDEPTEWASGRGRPRSPNFKINPAILTSKTSKNTSEPIFAGFAGCFDEAKNENEAEKEVYLADF